MGLVHADHRLLDDWVGKGNWLHWVAIHSLGYHELLLVWITCHTIGSRWYKSGRRRRENTVRLVLLLLSLSVSLLSVEGISYPSS